jgi:hypothetical protein
MIFQNFSPIKLMRMATPVLALALTAAITLTGQQKGKGGDDDPDRIVKGGAAPAGWSIRPDRGTPDQIAFTGTGGNFKVVGGPAGIFFNPAWTKSGNYKYSARLKQTKKASHPTSYGIMFGGSNLATPMFTYSYFLIRQGGEYFISNWDNGAGRPTTVTNWTAHQAIAKEAADGTQTNTVGIEVQGDNVIFSVNGTEVTRLPKSRVHADGMFGFRIGHNLDIEIDQVSR